MGSFDFTCAISGLPIAAGEAVRYLLLTQNPYHRGKKAGSFVCYSTDHWYPRVFPIRGKYNDYGSAEKLKGKAQQAVWLRGFRHDLVESGWGKNTVHDVAMSKTMPLSEILDGIHHGRLHVRDRRYADLVNRDRKKAKIPAWIPTRKRVEKRIAKLGFKNYDGNWGSDAFIVSRVDYITVKVRDTQRDGTVGGTERLAKLRDALAGDYAGMVTCGTDSASEHAELLLRPLPGIEPRGYSRLAAPKREPARISPVAHVMIREDVWQAIVALPLMGWGSEHTVEDARKKFAEAFAKHVKENKSIISLEASSVEEVKQAVSLLKAMRSLQSHDLIRNAVPFSTGPEESWGWMVDECAEGRADAKEVEDFCNTVAEFQHINQWLGMVRFLWHPAGGGPQNGEHNQHVAFLKAIESVASNNADRQRKDSEEFEAEYGATCAGITPPPAPVESEF